jgi:hypothetical protein
MGGGCGVCVGRGGSAFGGGGAGQERSPCRACKQAGARQQWACDLTEAPIGEQHTQMQAREARCEPCEHPCVRGTHPLLRSHTKGAGLEGRQAAQNGVGGITACQQRSEAGALERIRHTYIVASRQCLHTRTTANLRHAHVLGLLPALNYSLLEAHARTARLVHLSGGPAVKSLTVWTGGKQIEAVAHEKKERQTWVQRCLGYHQPASRGVCDASMDRSMHVRPAALAPALPPH